MLNNTGNESVNTHNECKYSITREDNKYNKYMKWHLMFFMGSGSTASQWFKTRKEAAYCVEHAIYDGQKGFHIGNYVSFTTYKEVTP